MEGNEVMLVSCRNKKSVVQLYMHDAEKQSKMAAKMAGQNPETPSLEQLKLEELKKEKVIFEEQKAMDFSKIPGGDEKNDEEKQVGEKEKTDVKKPKSAKKEKTATGKEKTALGKEKTATGKEKTTTGKEKTATGREKTASGKAATANGKAGGKEKTATDKKDRKASVAGKPKGK